MLFFTVYGPWGRPDMAPFLFTKAILEGEPIKVFNGGDMQRDFTYIDDIVRGIYLGLTAEPNRPKKSGSDARIYNSGGSRPVKLGDFISTIENASGRKAEKIMLPMQPGDVRSTWADSTNLQKDYGYAPSTPLEEGISRFVAWYKDFYRTDSK